jgi:uncharacterized protein YoxC
MEYGEIIRIIWEHHKIIKDAIVAATDSPGGVKGKLFKAIKEIEDAMGALADAWAVINNQTSQLQGQNSQLSAQITADTAQIGQLQQQLVEAGQATSLITDSADVTAAQQIIAAGQAISGTQSAPTGTVSVGN